MKKFDNSAFGTFKREFGRQRWMGMGVFVSAWRAITLAFEPMPF